MRLIGDGAAVASYPARRGGGFLPDAARRWLLAQCCAAVASCPMLRCGGCSEQPEATSRMTQMTGKLLVTPWLVPLAKVRKIIAADLDHSHGQWLPSPGCCQGAANVGPGARGPGPRPLQLELLPPADSDGLWRPWPGWSKPELSTSPF